MPLPLGLNIWQVIMRRKKKFAGISHMLTKFHRYLDKEVRGDADIISL
jgi:hypothetical protein